MEISRRACRPELGLVTDKRESAGPDIGLSGAYTPQVRGEAVALHQEVELDDCGIAVRAHWTQNDLECLGEVFLVRL